MIKNGKNEWRLTVSVKYIFYDHIWIGISTLYAVKTLCKFKAIINWKLFSILNKIIHNTFEYQFLYQGLFACSRIYQSTALEFCLLKGVSYEIISLSFLVQIYHTSTWIRQNDSSCSSLYEYAAKPEQAQSNWVWGLADSFYKSRRYGEFLSKGIWSNGLRVYHGPLLSHCSH